MTVKITQRQAPQFRAMIKTSETARLFDPEEDLATQAELEAEGLTGVYPAAYSVYRSTGGISPYSGDTGSAEPVEGYINREIAVDAFISPDDVETLELDYNFRFTPENRATFAFESVGAHFVDVKIMPKAGPAIVFRFSLVVI